MVPVMRLRSGVAHEEEEQMNTIRSDRATWQARGRCLDCRTKITGCRRVRRCLCGGKVRYR